MQDISRHILQPEKHYSGARMQKGRVILDSDVNEAELAVRTAGGTLAVIDLAPTHDGPEPTALPEVSRRGRELRLVSSERFRLLGPDVPEPTITPLPSTSLPTTSLPV